MINLVGIAGSSKHALQVLKKLKTIVLQPPFNKYTILLYMIVFDLKVCVSSETLLSAGLEFILYWNTRLRKATSPLHNSDAMVSCDNKRY